MIDNPLPNQVMQEKETLYVNEKFEEHCANSARELAQDHNLNQINVSLINCEDGLVITIPYSDLKDAKIQFQGGFIDDWQPTRTANFRD